MNFSLGLAIFLTIASSSSAWAEEGKPTCVPDLVRVVYEMEDGGLIGTWNRGVENTPDLEEAIQEMIDAGLAGPEMLSQYRAARTIDERQRMSPTLQEAPLLLETIGVVLARNGYGNARDSGLVMRAFRERDLPLEEAARLVREIREEIVERVPLRGLAHLRESETFRRRYRLTESQYREFRELLDSLSSETERAKFDAVLLLALTDRNSSLHQQVVQLRGGRGRVRRVLNTPVLELIREHLIRVGEIEARPEVSPTVQRGEPARVEAAPRTETWADEQIRHWGFSSYWPTRGRAIRRSMGRVQAYFERPENLVNLRQFDAIVNDMPIDRALLDRRSSLPWVHELQRRYGSRFMKSETPHSMAASHMLTVLMRMRIDTTTEYALFSGRRTQFLKRLAASGLFEGLNRADQALVRRFVEDLFFEKISRWQAQRGLIDHSEDAVMAREFSLGSDALKGEDDLRELYRVADVLSTGYVLSLDEFQTLLREMPVGVRGSSDALDSLSRELPQRVRFTFFLPNGSPPFDYANLIRAMREVSLTSEADVARFVSYQGEFMERIAKTVSSSAAVEYAEDAFQHRVSGARVRLGLTRSPTVAPRVRVADPATEVLPIRPSSRTGEQVGDGDEVEVPAATSTRVRTAD